MRKNNQNKTLIAAAGLTVGLCFGAFGMLGYQAYSILSQPTDYQLTVTIPERATLPVAEAENTEAETQEPTTETVEATTLEVAETAEPTVTLLSSELLPTDYVPGPDELPTDDIPAADATTETETGTVSEVATAAQPSTQTWGSYTTGQTISGTITYYDVCYSCCGSLSGVTASGLAIYNGMENPHIVSCNWLPLGTVIAIDGVEYTVADRGGASLSTPGRVDVFTPDGHQAALNLGVTYATITIVSFPES